MKYVLILTIFFSLLEVQAKAPQSDLLMLQALSNESRFYKTLSGAIKKIKITKIQNIKSGLIDETLIEVTTLSGFISTVKFGTFDGKAVGDVVYYVSEIETTSTKDQHLDQSQSSESRETIRKMVELMHILDISNTTLSYEMHAVTAGHIQVKIGLTHSNQKTTTCEIKDYDVKAQIDANNEFTYSYIFPETASRKLPGSENCD